MQDRQPLWRAASIGGLLALVVGCTASNDEQVSKQHSEGSTTSAPSILAGRAAHTATSLDLDTVVVAGGCVKDGCSEATASSFVLDSGGAYQIASMHTARDAHVGVRLNDGSLLVVGGFAEEGQPPLASAETYDLKTGKWSLTGELSVPRGGHDAALLGDGRVLVVGGWVRSRTYTETTEVFDPVNRTFALGPNLPEPVDGLTATSLDDGTVLVVGGQISPGMATGQTVIVSADGQHADQIAPLATPRFKHAAVKLPSGEVLIIGGTRDDSTTLTTTEIYDPLTRSFRPGPTMFAGRYKLAGGAAVLPDGRVVVAGSAAGLEILDVSSFTSRPATVGPAVPASFATTSVIGDRLRVIGGYDRAIRLSRSDFIVDLEDL